MYVFISCVKKKANKRCRAEEMYVSTLFKYMLRYAKQLTSQDKIFILSAKYGVLRLNDVIEPYELTLNNFSRQQRKRWAYSCVKTLEKMGVDFREQACFLCGVNYREYLAQVFKNHIVPMEGLGLGRQLQYLKGVLHEKDSK